MVVLLLLSWILVRWKKPDSSVAADKDFLAKQLFGAREGLIGELVKVMA